MKQLGWAVVGLKDVRDIPRTAQSPDWTSLNLGFGSQELYRCWFNLYGTHTRTYIMSRPIVKTMFYILLLGGGGVQGQG